MTLPIESALPALLTALSQRHEAVLEAPPGAGKTTGVPLALLHADWLKGQKILMLEPRRLAARASAQRMASLLGEPVGKTVGYRVRLDSCVSRDTRIEVVTEGILTRMLQDDPSLAGIGIVIFDEFHERSLDADLGLSLSLHAREIYGDLRDSPLKLLVMSATLDGEAVSRLLNDAPVIRSEGRSFPVDIRYGDSWRHDQDIGQRILATINEALAREAGSLLVFLPGQAEIRRVQTALESQHGANTQLIIAPLYGDLSLEQQRQAIEPPDAGRRKIVLATNIAETSLTIEGIDTVIDSGLCREPSFDPATGMTRLHTRRIARASSTQRAGRAGRLRPGRCYRLWSEGQQQELAAQSGAEIEQADLAALVLQCLQWGVGDVSELRWLTLPPSGAWQQALSLLHSLGAAQSDAQGRWQLSAHGRAMAQLPAHPRLAHLLLRGQALGLSEAACQLATLLSERDLLRDSDSSDLRLRLEAFHRAPRGAAATIRRLHELARQFSRLLPRTASTATAIADDTVPGLLPHTAGTTAATADDSTPGLLLALAYPDRIARQRNSGGTHYQLANGRSAVLGERDPLRNESWLVVAHCGGGPQASDRIFLAAALDPALFEGPLADQVTAGSDAGWDDRAGRFVTRDWRRIGALTLSEKTGKALAPEQKRQALLNLVREQGLQKLSWSPTAQQLRERVALLHTCLPEDDWPNWSDAALLHSLDVWLAPWLDSVNSLADLRALDLHNILHSQLSWPQQQALNELAPTHLAVPSGNRIAIDYSTRPPVLAVKLQEMFGCTETPTVARGRQALLIHLLSPARRPLQITQDLAGFWRSSYHEVKKEMKGRYPKHPWPDDPLQALPTARTKARQ